MTKKKSNKI